MISKVCTLMVVVLAFGVAFAVPDATAQETPTCVLVILADLDPPTPTPTDDADTVADAERDVQNVCADAAAYPGPFTTVPISPASPFVAPDLDAPVPAVVEQIEDRSVTTSTISSRDLAHSGTETFVLAYLGTGLLAFGAFAMGIRRGGRRG